MDICNFLTKEFLPRRDRLTQPDGRLLYLYKCDDDEFWCLVDLLTKCGPPDGHDFDRYLKHWQTFHEEVHRRRQYKMPTEATDLDWTVRGFVLYASEFWLRFKNEEWRSSTFPDRLPFKRLTWAQFLSLVGWTDLYHGKVAGYVKLRNGKYQLAHTNTSYSGENGHGVECGTLDANEPMEQSRPSKAGAPYYPGLYFPMLRAWKWWEVAPVRLPSSIRYLDTFAHQGGASDRLVLECEFAFESRSKLVYKPIRPPNGYGIDFLSVEKDSLPPNADTRDLSVALVFGTADGEHADFGI